MRIVTLFVGLLLLLALSAEAATPLTNCGTTSGSGPHELVGDLDCSIEGGFLRLQPGGKLSFNGFTMTGVNVFCQLVPSGGAVDPGGNCVMQGPGTMVDGFIVAERSVKVHDLVVTNGYVDSQRVRVRGSTISAPDDECVVNASGFIKERAIVSDSELVGGACGIRSDERVSLKRSIVRDSLGNGIVSFEKTTKIVESTVSGHAANGIAGMRVGVRDSTVTDNGGTAIEADHRGDIRKKSKLRVRGAVITGNGAGILALDDICGFCDPLDAPVYDSVVTGNAIFGIQSERGRVKIRDTVVTGNGTDSECGVSIACADIMARELPSVDDPASCGTSYDVLSGIPGSSWGVCSLD